MAKVVSKYDYANAPMKCELCRLNSVERVYMPFCSSCWRSMVRRGQFLSRNGHRYGYDGRKWYCLDELE